MTDFFDGWVHSEAARKDSIDLKRAYIDLCEGNLFDAVLFSQLMFWHEPTKKGDSRLTIFRDGHQWLAKRYEDWYEECRLDVSTARKCIDRLAKTGLIVKKVYHFKGKPTVHLRVDKEVFTERILALSATRGQIEPKRPDVADGNDTAGQMEMPSGSSCYKDTETTTETTTQKESLDSKSIQPSKQESGRLDLKVASKEKEKTPPSSARPPKQKEHGADFVAAAECAYGIAPDTNVPDSISDAVEKLVKAATDAFEVVFKTTDPEKIANAIRLFYKQHYPPNGKLRPIQKAPEFGAQFLAFIQTYRKPKAGQGIHTMPELPPVYQWTPEEIARVKAEALQSDTTPEDKIA